MRRRMNRSILAAVALAAMACAPGPEPAGGGVVADAEPWAARTALYEVFVRDFSPSGDLAGVEAGLDRIAASGAEVVWLMPIHPVGEANRKGEYGSPYSVRDYRAIHPDFGTEEDLRSLVAAAHERGLKLILDWVPNHTAWDHVWIEEHPGYYARNEAGEMTVPRDLEGNLTDWTDVVELDYSNPELRRAMTDAMTYWLREFDIDGFRVDVAGFIPPDFYRELIPALRSVRDEPILMLAEWGDLWLHEVGFELTYPWSSYGRLKEVWEGGPAVRFIGEEIEELERMPAGGYRMRMTTNHDETAWDEPAVTLFGGSEGARAAFVAMALLPGPPLLYNGQEIESPQRLGLFEKVAVDWDRPGGDEARTFYRRVIELSRTHPSLVAGGLELVVTDAEDDVIAYRRGDVLVLVNARPAPVTVGLDGVDPDGARDLLTGQRQRGAAVALSGFGAAVLELEADPAD